MTDILKRQLEYTPVVEGAPTVAETIVCGGMGGSALPAHALSRIITSKRFVIHRDYDLPEQSANALYVAISYSGNTEETLSFFEAAHAKGYLVAVITSGGTLLARARELGVPFVTVPEGIQPRNALLVLTKAFLALLGEQALIEELNVSAHTTGDVSGQAVTLADALTDRIPVVYASTTNEVLAYIMKIMMNETGKTPAFSNVFPEINHNEMQGFDVSAATAALASSCSLVLLRDSADHERIQKRMDVFENLMRERGVQVHSVSLPSASRCHQLVWTWLLARETGYLLAERYGVPADETPLITDFKRNL